MESDTEHKGSMMIEQDVLPHNKQIDPVKARFPYCIIWTPLPVISWLLPFVGHVGIGREDGVILDFAGPNFVCVDNFAFGVVFRSESKIRISYILPNFVPVSRQIAFLCVMTLYASTSFIEESIFDCLCRQKDNRVLPVGNLCKQLEAFTLHTLRLHHASLDHQIHR